MRSTITGAPSTTRRQARDHGGRLEGKSEKVVRRGDWNECEVICDGDLIQVKVNGLQTAEIRDTVRMKGVIALQLHRGPAMQAEFRNLRLKKIR